MGFVPNARRIRQWRVPQQYIAAGYRWVVDLDLEKFFDRVNHDRLMGQIARRVHDRRLLRLIRSWLKAGVLENGLVGPTDEGTPQGGPLSPLLSNLVLDQLDRELERRGHRFARYADDCNIYVRSRRAGQRLMGGLTRLLEGKLKLKVNREKSAVARPWERKFLGFSFTNGRQPKRRIAPKAKSRFEARVRVLTRRTRGISIETMVRELGRYQPLAHRPSVACRSSGHFRHRRGPGRSCVVLASQASAGAFAGLLSSRIRHPHQRSHPRVLCRARAPVRHLFRSRPRIASLAK